jgi:hypothetical protein
MIYRTPKNPHPVEEFGVSTKKLVDFPRSCDSAEMQDMQLGVVVLSGSSVRQGSDSRGSPRSIDKAAFSQG